MALFGRIARDSSGGHPLITANALSRLAQLGRGRYDGSLDVFDLWPMTYEREIETLSQGAQQRFLDALLPTLQSVGGWAVYGAEEIVDGAFGSAGKGNIARDAIFEASIEFQHDIGVWWQALSPMERLHWQKLHPGEPWQEEREPPTREQAQITPLPVGQERPITKLSRPDDARGFFVAHRTQGLYVLELDYPDDYGKRMRDPRDEAGDLYELYCRVGRGTPLPGVWADPEFEPFLRYPVPRI